MDEPQLQAEGNLEEVDEQEEPRAGPHEHVLGQRHGHEVDGHHRPCGVGDHGHAAGQQSDAPGEGSGVRQVRKRFRPPVADELDHRQGQHDDPDDRAEVGLSPEVHHRPTHNHSNARRRKSSADVMPIGVASEEQHRTDVAHDQHRQHDSRRLKAREELGEEHHVQQADSGQPALRNADAHRSQTGQCPLLKGQIVGHAQGGVAED